LLPRNFREIDFSAFKKLAVGMTIGFICGVQILKNFDPFWLKKFFGVAIIFYVISQFFPRVKFNPPDWSGILFGFFGGFFSGVFAFGGPFFVIFAHGKIPNPRNLRATIIAILAISNFLRIPLFWQNGLLSSEVFLKSLSLFPAFFAAIFLGEKIARKIEPKKFRQLFLVLIFCSGIILATR
jgi:hypothetical protein